MQTSTSRYTHLEFLRIFAVITNKPGAGPNQYVDAWDQFVSFCEEGYNFCSTEYDHDLLIRNRIQAILDSDELKQFPEYSIFEYRIAVIDQRFFEILLPDVLPNWGQYWWEKGMVKHGCQELVDDVLNRYGLRIELVT